MSLVVDIEKRLGPFRLDVDFETDAGEVLALLGASGSGKSMTLKCIAGIEKPDRGKIILNGRTLFDSEKRVDLPPQKRRVGCLFQQYALFPHMTVYENIRAGARRRPDAENAVAEKIAALRLTGLEDKRPHELSGGQQQRVALARILVNGPEALLLDEPFSALDSYLRWELELELADTLAGFTGPSVFVSPSREEVFRLCSQICVLSDGRSEGKRGAAELFAHPETRAACLLSGCKNLSRAAPLGNGRVAAGDWGIELDTGAEDLEDIAYIGVKSRHVRLAEAGGENVFACTVTRVVRDERRCIVTLATPAGRGGCAGLTMTVDFARGSRLKAGEKLLITIAPSDIMLLRN